MAYKYSIYLNILIHFTCKFHCIIGYCLIYTYYCMCQGSMLAVYLYIIDTVQVFFQSVL